MLQCYTVTTIFRVKSAGRVLNKEKRFIEEVEAVIEVFLDEHTIEMNSS